MSYHNFSNLGENFNSDLQGKVMREIDDKTWNMELKEGIRGYDVIFLGFQNYKI